MENLDLSQLQKKRILRALTNNTGLTLKLRASQLDGNNQFMLTLPQQKRLKKARHSNTGVQLKLSISQLKRNRKGGMLGEGFFDDMVSGFKIGFSAPLKGVELLGREAQHALSKKKPKPIPEDQKPFVYEFSRRAKRAGKDPISYAQTAEGRKIMASLMNEYKRRTGKGVEGGALPLIPLIISALPAISKATAITKTAQKAVGETVTDEDRSKIQNRLDYLERERNRKPEKINFDAYEQGDSLLYKGSGQEKKTTKKKQCQCHMIGNGVRVEL